MRSSEQMALVLEGRNRALEKLATGAPLDEVLKVLVVAAEDVLPGLRCSVLLYDSQTGRLQNGAAGCLPDFYLEAIEGLEVGNDVGSCGAAVFRGKRVVAEDVRTHPNWSGYQDLARRAGIRACWSEPVFSSTGETLGTLALHYSDPREPDDFELDFMRTTAHLAGIAIERTRFIASTRQSAERFRQLAESIHEVFWLTDWCQREVLYVSPAYETIWGRSCQSLYDDAKSWSHTILPEDVDRVVAAFDEKAAEGTFDEEYRIQRKDGTIRWIRDRAFPIYDHAGDVYRLAGISEDITMRKTAEEELENARAELDRRTQARLESMASELLLAEERERRRLAVDLHDGLNQLMTVALMKLRGLPSGDSPTARALSEVESIIEKANQVTRSLTYQLSPPILHDLGFEPAVQWLVEDVRGTFGLDISLRDDGCNARLDERVRILLFRAVRELLMNVAKHARATCARVTLRTEAQLLQISVEDDGVAFESKAVGVRGIGLYSIRERLSHLGGRMEIDSSQGQGTRVTLVAPLARETSLEPG